MFKITEPVFHYIGKVKIIYLLTLTELTYKYS